MNPILQHAFVTSLICMGLSLVVPADAQPAAETQVAPAPRSARALVELTCAQADLGMSVDSITVLVNSNSILKHAARELLGLPPDRLGDEVRAEFSRAVHRSTNEHGTIVFALLAELVIHVPGDVPGADAKAEQLLAAVCKRLEAALSERAAFRLRQLQADAERARARAAQTEQELARLHELQRKLLAEAGRSNLDRDNLADELNSLEREGRELDMNLASLHARQNALTEQIGRIGREIPAREAQDPVALELDKVVKLREQALDKLLTRAKQGMATADEIADGEERLAQARAELARQRLEAAHSAGGELLSDLNKELVSTAVEIASAEARREYVRTQLAQAAERKLLELADRYDREVAHQLEIARKAVEDAARERVNAENAVAAYRPPTVTIVGGPPPT